jgi:hypothetical protein
MEKYMLEHMRKVEKMVTANFILRMVIFIKANFAMIRNMEKVCIKKLMELMYMKVNIEMTKNVVKENLSVKIKKYILEISKMILSNFFS